MRTPLFPQLVDLIELLPALKNLMFVVINHAIKYFELRAAQHLIPVLQETDVVAGPIAQMVRGRWKAQKERKLR